MEQVPTVQVPTEQVLYENLFSCGCCETCRLTKTNAQAKEAPAAKEAPPEQKKTAPKKQPEFALAKATVYLQGELARQTTRKLNNLTEEEFVRLVVEPAEDME